MNDRLTIIHIAIVQHKQTSCLFISQLVLVMVVVALLKYQPSNIPPDLILRVDKTELGPISNINEPLMKHFQF